MNKLLILNISIRNNIKTGNRTKIETLLNETLTELKNYDETNEIKTLKMNYEAMKRDLYEIQKLDIMNCLLDENDYLIKSYYI